MNEVAMPEIHLPLEVCPISLVQNGSKATWGGEKTVPIWIFILMYLLKPSETFHLTKGFCPQSLQQQPSSVLPPMAISHPGPPPISSVGASSNVAVVLIPFIPTSARLSFPGLLASNVLISTPTRIAPITFVLPASVSLIIELLGSATSQNIRYFILIF